MHAEELQVIADHVADIQARVEKIQGEREDVALEAVTQTVQAALAAVQSLKFHVLDNNVGKLSARVEEQRKTIDEQVTAIVAELKQADQATGARVDAAATALRKETELLANKVADLRTQLAANVERVELSAREELKKLAAIQSAPTLNPTGSYADNRAYNRLDIVSYLGGSYISNVDDNRDKPSTKSKKWTQLAARPAGFAGGVPALQSISGVLTLAQGGTGATTAAAAATALGLGTGSSPTFSALTVSNTLAVNGITLAGTTKFGVRVASGFNLNIRDASVITGTGVAFDALNDINNTSVPILFRGSAYTFDSSGAVTIGGNLTVSGEANIGTVSAYDPTGYSGPVLNVAGALNGAIQVGASVADADATTYGDYSFMNFGTSATEKRLAFIRGQTSGSTANNRGGKISVQLKNDGASTFTEALALTTAAATLAGNLTVSGTTSAIGAAVSSTTNLNLAAGTTGVSSLRIPHGSAPTSPVNGDMWTTTAGLFIRINGATVGPLS